HHGHRTCLGPDPVGLAGRRTGFPTGVSDPRRIGPGSGRRVPRLGWSGTPGRVGFLTGWVDRISVNVWLSLRGAGPLAWYCEADEVSRSNLINSGQAPQSIPDGTWNRDCFAALAMTSIGVGRDVHRHH